MRNISIIIILFFFTKVSNGQSSGVGGQYVFERKGEMFSSYVFSSDNLFTSFLSGDMGTFYGEGKYQIIDGKLILSYDSTGVVKKVNKRYYITPTGTDTLTVLNIEKKKIDLYCDYTGQIETYTRLKFRQKKSNQ